MVIDKKDGLLSAGGAVNTPPNEMHPGDGAVSDHSLFVSRQLATAGQQQTMGQQGIPPGFFQFQAAQAQAQAQMAPPPGLDVLQLQAQGMQAQALFASANAPQAVPAPGIYPFQAQAQATQMQAMCAAAVPPGVNPFQAQAQAQAMQNQAVMAAAGVAAPPGFGWAPIPAAQQQPMVVQGIHPGFVPAQQEQQNQMMPNGAVFSPGFLSHGNLPFQTAGAVQPQAAFAAANPLFLQEVNNTVPGQQFRGQLSSQQQRQQQLRGEQQQLQQHGQRQDQLGLLITAAEQQRRTSHPAPRVTEPMLVHDPNRSQQDSSQQGPSEPSEADVPMQSGHQYHQLEDGSYMVRYTDAGISTDWVHMECPPIST